MAPSQQFHVVVGAFQTAATRAPAQTRRDQPNVFRPLRRESSEVGTGSRSAGRGFRAGVPCAPELSEKAKAAAQGVPVGVQLEQSLKFVERSEKRLRVLDEERAKEARLLEEAQ